MPSLPDEVDPDEVAALDRLAAVAEVAYEDYSRSHWSTSRLKERYGALTFARRFLQIAESIPGAAWFSFSDHTPWDGEFVLDGVYDVNGDEIEPEGEDFDTWLDSEDREDVYTDLQSSYRKGLLDIYQAHPDRAVAEFTQPSATIGVEKMWSWVERQL